MDNNTPRAEAERWLGISGKLLTARDFLGSKTFALRARESDPTNHLSDQILAVVDTVLAAEKRLPTATHHPDWYSVLQLPRLVRDPELISGHYRRLVMLLDPDRNRLPFADYALRLVIDGWSVLSDPTKKWIFDNELSVYLQSVENHHHQFQQQQQQPPPPQQQQMINTFQFLQSPATATAVSAAVVEQPSPSTAALMWQQLQQQQQHHHSNDNNSFININNSINNNVSQIEFMQAPPPPAAAADMRRQEVEMLPPQWRVREDAAAAAEGMRRFADVAPVVSNVVNATVVAPVPVVVVETPKVIETGNNNNDNEGGIRVRVSVLGENNLNNNINDNSNNNDNNVEDDGIRVSVVEEDEDVVVNEEKDDENVEEVDGENVDGGGRGEVVESFWTSCPYCFYTYEYQKMYQECTMRCQNCRRGFHAIKVADPPSIDGGEEGGKEGKKISSFGSWGFFPLGFSKVGWKKGNQVGKSNVASTWMPFSPMFVSPVENGSAAGGGGGGVDFKWFSSSGAAAVGPKNLGRMPASRPRVYIDEDGFDSGPSESDSSDKDWRRNPAHEKKMTKKRRVSAGKMRKVRASYVRLPSIGPRDVVMGLHAVVNNNAGKKKVASTVGRNPVKRKVKNMGRLDLNVEFNNEGDEHAPAVSAVNGEDDAIENIGFFEGLDEFFSTLPILNVSGEKAKPS